MLKPVTEWKNEQVWLVHKSWRRKFIFVKQKTAAWVLESSIRVEHKTSGTKFFSLLEMWWRQKFKKEEKAGYDIV